MRRIALVLGTVALLAACAWSLRPGAEARAEAALRCDLVDVRGFLHRGDTFMPGAKVSRTRVVIGCGRTPAERVPWELGVFWIKSTDPHRHPGEASCTYSAVD